MGDIGRASGSRSAVGSSRHDGPRQRDERAPLSPSTTPSPRPPQRTTVSLASQSTSCEDHRSRRTPRATGLLQDLASTSHPLRPSLDPRAMALKRERQKSYWTEATKEVRDPASAARPRADSPLLAESVPRELWITRRGGAVGRGACHPELERKSRGLRAYHSACREGCG